MTTQITVRLPDHLVEFVDGEVRSGSASSRADAVARALLRERRRQRALADVAILRREAEAGEVDDLDALVRYQSEHPVPLDD